MNPDVITTDLKQVLKRLKLGPILDTLPERLALARQQKMPHQDFLLLILSDEVTRRDSVSAQLRRRSGRWRSRPRPLSIDSPATPTTWSSTASPTAPARNPPSHARRKLDPGGRPDPQSPSSRRWIPRGEWW